MRVLGSFFAASCLVGCGSVAVYPIAVGAEGSLPTWNGPCDTTSVRGDAVRIEDSSYSAIRPGQATLACRDGDVRLEVRAAARLTIEGPTQIGPEFVSFRLMVAAADGARLDLGNADVAWTIPDSLERGSSCHGEMIPTCDPPSVIRVRARTAADAVIGADFAGLHVTRAIEVLR